MVFIAFYVYVSVLCFILLCIYSHSMSVHVLIQLIQLYLEYCTSSFVNKKNKSTQMTQLAYFFNTKPKYRLDNIRPGT